MEKSLYQNIHCLLCTTCAWWPQRPEECMRSPGTELEARCELPCGHCEPNPSPLQEYFFLITKLSFQHLKTSYHDVIRLA